MSSPEVSSEDVDTVLQVLRSPNLSMGPYLGAFEAEIAQIAGTAHAVAVSSGTAGLHLAVILTGIGSGDLVVTTPFSFVASSNCLLYEGAVPVFVDVEEQTGNIQTDLVREAVETFAQGGPDAARLLPPALQSKKRAVKPVRAILPVDVFIQPADFDPLMDIAHSHNIPILEDSCEAIGSAYKNRPAGSLGDVGVFAFYPNKQMTTGEGGVLVTNRADWADLARSLRNQGRQPGGLWLEHHRLGYNYRMDEMSAALGTAQARRLPELLEKRARVAGWYSERLKDVEQVRLPSVAPTTTKASWFVYVVRIMPPVSRDRVIELLAGRGIPARKYFSPIHLQPYFMERFGYRKGDFPVTERLGDESLALPFSGVITEDQVDIVCRALRDVVSP
jgi:dTDP-4-amino-4,6-dideoxygalactose transaminase